MPSEKYVPPPVSAEDRKRKERFETIRGNWFSIPRWMRRGIRPPRPHEHEGEEARRRRQIEAGVLGPSSRGVVRLR